MVNALLKEELEREGGIHALQLRTLNPEEEEKLDKKVEEGVVGWFGWDDDYLSHNIMLLSYLQLVL